MPVPSKWFASLFRFLRPNITNAMDCTRISPNSLRDDNLHHSTQDWTSAQRQPSLESSHKQNARQATLGISLISPNLYSNRNYQSSGEGVAVKLWTGYSAYKTRSESIVFCFNPLTASLPSPFRPCCNHTEPTDDYCMPFRWRAFFRS